jgi:60 kDa SS-A/Ro ribonucleoprotein
VLQVEKGDERMANYTKHFNLKQTPQTEPVPGKTQVKNSAGGFVFDVSDWERLNRFLILGTQGGTYYITERKLTIDNAECVIRCLKSDGLRVVRTIVEISDKGRAPKNDPALFALAIASALGDLETRQAAFAALPKVARQSTFLFQYLQYVQSMRGWGGGLRRAVKRWYNEMPLEKLAYQVIKYPERITEEGVALSKWSHRDVLRVAHPVAEDAGHNKLYDYVTKGWDKIPTRTVKDLQIIVGAEKMKKASTKKEVIELIEKHKLPHETVPKQFANDADVWRALLPNMPLTATMRMLGRLTKYGVIAPGSMETKDIVEKLTDPEYVKKSRMHPLNVLVAFKTYAQGKGLKGDLVWNPDRKISDALDEMFYLSFGNVEPTGKRLLMGLDVSGSMGAPISGMQSISCAEGCAVMAMVTARVEQDYDIMAFNSGFQPLDISPKMRLDHVLSKVSNVNFGGTDCALPMLYASQHKMKVDGFMVLTDSETWANPSMHPFQALQQYRASFVKDACLVVVGMNSTGFTIADKDDHRSLDVVGFDSAAPGVISSFIRGDLTK